MKYPIGTRVYYQNPNTSTKDYGTVIKDVRTINVQYPYTWVNWDTERLNLWIDDRDLHLAESAPIKTPKWEYKLVSVKDAIAEESVQEFLNKYGEEGWELTTIDYGSFILKRMKE